MKEAAGRCGNPVEPLACLDQGDRPLDVRKDLRHRIAQVGVARIGLPERLGGHARRFHHGVGDRRVSHPGDALVPAGERGAGEENGRPLEGGVVQGCEKIRKKTFLFTPFGGASNGVGRYSQLVKH